MTMENDKILETLQKEIAALQELLDQIQPDWFKETAKIHTGTDGLWRVKKSGSPEF